nr:MAG TPA: hypothetical protein [Caudoviricetes sp.]
MNLPHISCKDSSCIAKYKTTLCIYCEIMY